MYLEFTYRLPRFFTITLLAAQAVLVGFSPSNYIFFGEHVLSLWNALPECVGIVLVGSS